MTDEQDRETVLREAGVIVDCDRGDDLCLDEAFREEWYAAMRSIRGAKRVESLVRDAVGSADSDEGDADSDEGDTDSDESSSGETDVEIHAGDGGVFAYRDGRLAAFWESEAAVVADRAADRVLVKRLPRWEHRAPDDRSAVTRGLRVFLDRCPVCEGYATIETVRSQSPAGTARTVVHCSTCDVTLFRSASYADLPDSPLDGDAP